MMNDYWGHTTGTQSDSGGIIVMLLILLFVIIGVAFVVRYIGHTAPASKSDSSALELLQRRYAQGEIDTKEFEEKRKVLNG